MNITTAKRVLLSTTMAAITHGRRANGVHLESGPGVGKSDSVRQAAAELARATGENVGLVVFMLATVTSADVRGFMMPRKSDKDPSKLETVFSTPPWYPVPGNTDIVEPDGTWHDAGSYSNDVPDLGFLFLDEFSQAEEDVKKPAAELVYKGGIGTTHLPIGWRVISAGNRMSDRSGVLREMMFIVNRRCKWSIEPHLPSWLKWADELPGAARPNFMTISFAQKNPDIVFKDAIPAGSDPYCTPRSLVLMDQDLRALCSEDDVRAGRLPTDATAREVCAGWIGDAACAQFFTHLKYGEEIPTIEEVERDPKRAKKPDARDAQMVAAYMLAHNVTEKNTNAVIAYINRLQVEMQVLGVRAVLAQQDRARAIVTNEKFTEWLTKNKELLIASRY